MARIKNASIAKLKDLSKADQVFAISHGKTYLQSPEMFHFASELGLFCDTTSKIPVPTEVFFKLLKLFQHIWPQLMAEVPKMAESKELFKRLQAPDGKDVITFAVKVMNLVFDCYAGKDAKKLHHLADAIEIVGKPHRERENSEIIREWLHSYLFGLNALDESSYEPLPKRKFSEIRDACNAHSMDPPDDSTLRRMLTELNYTPLPEKRGPKGPRVKH